MMLQAAAFKVFGFGLLVQRDYLLVCGLGAVLMWYLALRRLIADRVCSPGVDFAVRPILSFSRFRPEADLTMISLFLRVWPRWRRTCIGVSGI